jgi:hypothetical protein
MNVYNYLLLLTMTIIIVAGSGGGGEDFEEMDQSGLTMSSLSSLLEAGDKKTWVTGASGDTCVVCGDRASGNSGLSVCVVLCCW